MQRNRIVDIAKGVGILLVVLGHSKSVMNGRGELFRIVFSFHMPLFFFLSGVFLSAKHGYVAKRFHGLLRPYLLVMFVILSLKLAKGYLLGASAGSDGAVVYAKAIYGTATMIPWVPLWFLPHLFVALIFCHLALRCGGMYAELHAALIALPLLYVGVVWLEYFATHGVNFYGFRIEPYTGLAWSIDLAPITCSYIFCGYGFRKKVLGLQWSGIGFAASLGLFAMLHMSYDETIDLATRYYGNFLIATLQAGLGIYLCLNVASFLSDMDRVARMFSYMGSGSLFIMIFHSPIQWACAEAMHKSTANSYAADLLGFVASLSISLVIFEIVRRNRFLASALLGRHSWGQHQVN